MTSHFLFNDRTVGMLREQSYFQRALILVLVLLPIFVTTLRHWGSAAFALISVFAIISLFRGSPRPLGDAERGVAYATIGLFLAYIGSAWVNGWDKDALRLLEREVRYLMLLPLILLFARRNFYFCALSTGVLMSIPVTCSVILYQYYCLGLNSDLGVYGPLFTGPATVFLYAIAFPFARNSLCSVSLARVHYTIFFMVAMIALFTSRSALVGLSVILIYVFISHGKREFFKHIFVFVFAICFFFLLVGDSLQAAKLSATGQQLSDYFFARAAVLNLDNTVGNNSVSTRLELLKGAYYLSLENPIFGVGPYNFQHHIGEVARLNGLDMSLEGANHPHNVFAEVMVSKGLLGLVSFIYLLWVFFRARRGSLLSVSGRMAMLVILSMMLTESAIVLKNNFVSLWILGLAILTCQSGDGRVVFDKNPT